MTGWRNRLRSGRIVELLRYYQAALANAAFGFGMYSFLLWTGANLYVAQIVSYSLGVTFNYFTYRRHVFREAAPAKLRFVMAYGLNYLVNLSFLALFDMFVVSPYVTGLLATIAASLLNYFILKHVVFVRATET